MKLFPNPDNNRLLARFAACVLIGALLSGILGIVVPHFVGWQAVGPTVLMLLIGIFVIPHTVRRPR